MYSLTIIRINTNTSVFENTEYHGLVPYENLLHQLQKRNASQSNFDQLNNLEGKGFKTTIEIHSELSTWFCYITKEFK